MVPPNSTGGGGGGEYVIKADQDFRRRIHVQNVDGQALWVMVLYKTNCILFMSGMTFITGEDCTLVGLCCMHA